MRGEVVMAGECPPGQGVVHRFEKGDPHRGVLVVEQKIHLQALSFSQADLDLTINTLRDRVGMPPLKLDAVPVDPRYTADGITPIIAEIRRERRVELFMEGFRYNDLRRWKQGKKLLIPTLGITSIMPVKTAS